MGTRNRHNSAPFPLGRHRVWGRTLEWLKAIFSIFWIPVVLWKRLRNEADMDTCETRCQRGLTLAEYLKFVKCIGDTCRKPTWSWDCILAVRAEHVSSTGFLGIKIAARWRGFFGDVLGESFLINEKKDGFKWKWEKVITWNSMWMHVKYDNGFSYGNVEAEVEGGGICSNR